MVCPYKILLFLINPTLTPFQLTKEEEASATGEDLEVRREDQEKINRFSSLHQKETALEEQLQGKIVSALIRVQTWNWQHDWKVVCVGLSEKSGLTFVVIYRRRKKILRRSPRNWSWWTRRIVFRMCCPSF